jgi:ABC-type polysaccharide/polyol phosphate export permease
MPVPLLALFCFTLGCGFFVAAANVFYRDVSHIIQIVLSGWFYLSPVMYSLEFLPQHYRPLFRLNPMLYLLNEFRMAIYYGQLPSLQSIAVSLAIGFTCLYAGYIIFRRSENIFVYYV